MPYDPLPRYPTAGGSIEVGYESLAYEIAERRPSTLALDGPASLQWDHLTDRLGTALGRAGVGVTFLDARRYLVDADEIERRTLSGPLHADPVFAPLYGGGLAQLVEPPAQLGASNGMTVVVGPGSSRVEHDALWYADHPKRVGLEAVKRGSAGCLGLPAGHADAPRRLVFVDWPMIDRHKSELLPRLARFVDLSDPDEPRSLAGDALRRSLRELAAGPFRTRPTFSPGPWGGQWLRQTLKIPAEGPNLAWSYELIAPESSVLLGEGEAVEVGLELVLAAAGREVLGGEVARRFGTSFPIRFDYLDTLEGGHLSVHCHPRAAYMREIFGWPYTQHESYYVMATRPGAFIFLGLRDGVDAERFRREAERSQLDGSPLDIEQYVQTHPARRHGLYLIPAGTPHASSEGNVVLEISATPYLYSLRFYDWLREDLDGTFRPVQLEHAFANLNLGRSGAAVRDELLPEPRTLRAGNGFAELELGRHRELFFAINRLDFVDEVSDRCEGRFHVLNLVEGEEIEIETDDGHCHRLAYAETLLVPAIVGGYRLRRVRGGTCKVVKAFVA